MTRDRIIEILAEELTRADRDPSEDKTTDRLNAALRTLARVAEECEQ